MDLKPISSSVSPGETREQLDRLLEELVLEAKQYPPKSKERRAVITRLWCGMKPPNSKRRSPLATDNDARNRLGRTKSSLRQKYGEQLYGASFEDCWNDNLSTAQLEFLEKIDIYNLGVDYIFFKHWQDFLSRICQPTPGNNDELEQDYRWFRQKVEEFSRRFVSRQQKNHRLGDEEASKIFEACQNFSDRCCQPSAKTPTNLQSFWDELCLELQQYYSPKSVWNWFEYILRNCFKNSVREWKKRCFQEVSGDAPIAYSFDGSDRCLCLFETLASPDSFEEIETDIPKPKELVDLLEENPYEIFSSKHLKGHPEITFREIALLKTKDFSWEEIAANFGNKASGTRTISPFYSRNKKYFEPIIKEYLSDGFPLPPESVALPDAASLQAGVDAERQKLERIEKDSDRRFAQKKMKQHQQVNFKDLVETKAKGETWEKVAADLGVADIKSLMIFYLDAISAFKLLPQEKKKKQKSS
ncbi:MAG: hypothetical protein F6K35_39290 [Okeania sp. SIO2H7]|nr:hypothetical protein [Okeania sp. SIO2H7]